MRRNKNCCRQANYTVDMCFIEMIYRQDILHGERWTQVVWKWNSKGGMSGQLVIKFWQAVFEMLRVLV